MPASVSVKLNPEQFDMLRELINEKMNTIEPLFKLDNPDRPDEDTMKDLRVRYMKLDNLKNALR